MPLRNSLFVHQLPQGHLSTKTQSRTNSFGNASPKYALNSRDIDMDPTPHVDARSLIIGIAIGFLISFVLFAALFIATARSRLVNGLRLSGPQVPSKHRGNFSRSGERPSFADTIDIRRIAQPRRRDARGSYGTVIDIAPIKHEVLSPVQPSHSPLQRRPDHTPHIYGRGEGWLYGNGAGAPSLSDGSTESPVDSRPSTGGTYSSQQPLTQRRSTQNNATTSSNATPPSLSAHLRVRTTHLTPQPSSNRYALSSPSAYSDDSSINEIPSASESFHPIPIPSGSRGRRRSKSTDEKQRPRTIKADSMATSASTLISHHQRISVLSQQSSLALGETPPPPYTKVLPNVERSR